MRIVAGRFPNRPVTPDVEKSVPRKTGAGESDVQREKVEGDLFGGWMGG